MTAPGSRSDELRCPICGAELADIEYDAEAEGEPLQDPNSRQSTRYRCGHSVIGPRLAEADPAALDVEQRTSDETVEET